MTRAFREERTGPCVAGVRAVACVVTPAPPAPGMSAHGARLGRCGLGSWPRPSQGDSAGLRTQTSRWWEPTAQLGGESVGVTRSPWDTPPSRRRCRGRWEGKLPEASVKINARVNQPLHLQTHVKNTSPGARGAVASTALPVTHGLPGCRAQGLTYASRSISSSHGLQDRGDSCPSQRRGQGSDGVHTGLRSPADSVPVPLAGLPSSDAANERVTRKATDRQRPRRGGFVIG